MVGTLLIVAIVAAILGGVASSRSGEVWAYLRTVGFAALATSLLLASLLLVVGGGPLPGDPGTSPGRGAFIWRFFHSIGSQGTALVLGILGLVIARGVYHQIQLLRSGVYSGGDELDKRIADQGEFSALIEKVESLAAASKADAAWILAQPKTYSSHDEAEKLATELNAAKARIAAREEEITRLLARGDELMGVQPIPGKLLR